MSEENLKKEQKGKNPLELDIRFLKYYYTSYEHSVAAVLSMFGSTEFESNASLKRNPSPKRICMDRSLHLQYPGEHKRNFCCNLQTSYFFAI